MSLDLDVKTMWSGGKWGSMVTITDEMLASMPSGELERMLARYAESAHEEGEKAAAAAGVPKEARTCEHVMDVREDIDGLGRSRYSLTCQRPTVRWVKAASHSIGEFMSEALPAGWCVVGHEELGKFSSEGEALAKAWSVTKPGDRRPEVEGR